MKSNQYISLEVTVRDSTFIFLMPNNSSWGTALDASFEVLQEIMKNIEVTISEIKKKEPENG